jgi:UDP-2,4-diacetamido-2,4,6-trideoxy-beta-L-altropyranose hydrolase
MASTIEARGHTVHRLPPLIPGPEYPPEDPAEPVHAPWLIGGWKYDAEQTRTILTQIEPRWVIVDHYGIDYRWESALADCCEHLMVIDDLADRRHVCDLLLDQNWFGPGTEARYDRLVPSTAIKLLGPACAMLRPDYHTLRSLMPPRDGFIARVLVFMGGSDPDSETGKALKALSRPDLSHLMLDVVLGTNYPDKPGIEQLVASRSGANLHQNLPSLAGLMARADLMVGAGGSTTWERMCLGLPALVISIAANQTPTNQALMEAGYIHFLGERSSVSEDDIARAVQDVLASPERMREQSRRIQALVTGDGAATVASYLTRS